VGAAVVEASGQEGSTPIVVRENHHCVGCGRLNPHGLKLSFFVDPDGSVWADWTPAREQEGYSGIAHGGLITTVLDEVMGWVLSYREIWAVTGRLSVNFRKPVEIGVPTRARAWILNDHGRKIDVCADLLRREDGLLLADASGVFVRVPEEVARKWQERYVSESPDERS
jgi:acyl-coenzyme A thioesterase PaaI-like protein